MSHLKALGAEGYMAQAAMLEYKLQSCRMHKELGAEKEAINSACVQLVLEGGILYKYHRNLPWSPPSLHISLWITNTCHQLLIRLIASTLFYSTLGNTETPPAVPLLKQRLCVQDNGGRAGATGVFLGKNPHLDGRWGRWNFRRHIFQS